MFDFEWKDGSNRVLSGLGADGAVVDDGWATEHGTKVGDAFTVTSAKGVKLPLDVRGIENSPVLDSLGLGPITVSKQAFDRAFETQRDRLAFVTTSDPAAVEKALAAFPDAHVLTKDGFINGHDGRHRLAARHLHGAAGAGGDRVAVRDRQHARALDLRAHPRAGHAARGRHDAPAGPADDPPREHHHGAARRRDGHRRRPRHRGVLASVFADEGITFAVPVGSLVAFAVVAIVAGVLAAILPARRAARMDVLTALAYE